MMFMPIPTRFYGKPYSAFFFRITRKFGIVPLALYRPPSIALGNIVPFVYTNPAPETPLLQGDNLIVVAAGLPDPTVV